ncbi:hypothetical protein [Paenibacillus sp. UASWS1643]|uniref:hypothetical protein n=1 Tax=Paenibacillus sp. UASWS1643 TaxID=2580422 RepID=UPI001CC302FF|nr:hypothetical protein [Paenibacillus sp. UASWS1643]
MTTEALVTLKEVSKKYGNRDVLTDVSLTINKGDCLILRETMVKEKVRSSEL